MIEGMASFWGLIRKAKELYSWYSFVVGVGFLMVTGVGLAIGAPVWLVKIGIPLPIAAVAGYCTFVGAVYLAMAPLANRALVRIANTTPSAKPKEDRRPNYPAVRLQHRYALGPVSRLWVDLDPRANATYDSQAWYETLVSAIQQKKLGFAPRHREQRMIDLEREKPDYNTIVARDELKRYASSIGEDPPFLRDN